MKGVEKQELIARGDLC